MSAQESGHWYRRDGSPCYEVPRKNGPGMRGVDLRWDRGLALVPSVTTVTSIIAKPALTNWMVTQGVMAALTDPEVHPESLIEEFDEVLFNLCRKDDYVGIYREIRARIVAARGSDEVYIARILADSRQQAIAAAEEGSRIHDACEQLVKTGNCPDAYRKHADAAVAELRRLFPDVNDWIAEKSFAHPLGFGGKVDLHSPSTGIVADYKTKDGDFTDGKRLDYDQNVQLAAYQVGLNLCLQDRHPEPFLLTHVPCANIFVSRTHPGAVASHVWEAEQIAHGWQTFEAALQLWKIIKRYDGSFV